MTINVNRLVQEAVWDKGLADVREAMAAQVEKLHKYLLAFNEILKERQAAGLDQKMSEDTSAAVKVGVEAVKRLIALDRTK